MASKKLNFADMMKGIVILLVVFYHILFAITGALRAYQITGFSMKYEETVEMATLGKSVMLCAVVLTLCILRYVIEDKIKAGKE
ncbi:hypothetical protein [Butyrivibrio sp. AE3004]|uniref:hypothetical protein n=1 Tax=Butyrivibrio sp. AE3004 TaxID=1506994 RepID=UPI000493BA4E|nr:hypothetical protein [Butyrivibrio sp. AE3004]